MTHRVAFLLLLVYVPLANSLIHNLTITDDTRPLFFIENFGFEEKGHLKMDITNWKLNGENWAPSDKDKNSLGFLIKRTATDSSSFIEENSELQCMLSEEFVDKDTYLIFVDNWNHTSFSLVIQKDKEGFYNTFFINCKPKSTGVSFNLRLEQYNVDAEGEPSYLSAGFAPLPILFAALAAVWGGCFLFWVMTLLRSAKEQRRRVHHLMTLLLVLKMLSVLFESVDYHFTNISGQTGYWAYAYYIFTGLKGTIMFVLIALIGSGWAFVKPFLSELDRKIVLVVIPLQVLDNIALIIFEEMAPGSKAFITWRDIFRVVDIICCGAILIPIIWSMKHLREASQIDGKAAQNLAMLKVFRQFYLMVVSYIYFTRIIVSLLNAILPFRLIWLGSLFTEIATLAFFSITGYKFRPSHENPYFRLADQESETEMESTKINH